jgi:hypothetical protein
MGAQLPQERCTVQVFDPDVAREFSRVNIPVNKDICIAASDDWPPDVLFHISYAAAMLKNWADDDTREAISRRVGPDHYPQYSSQWPTR